MTDNRIRRIAILGSGVAAWLAAVALSKILPRPCIVSVVDGDPNSDQDLLWETGASSLAAIKSLHRLLGIDERDFMRSTRATFKLGTEYAGWNGSESSFFQPLGQLGAPIEGIAFHHLWHLTDQPVEELAHYSLCAVAARLGRFAHPSHDPRSVLSTLEYGYHFDPELYRNFLRERALAAGVVRVPATLRSVQLKTDGLIEGLVLDSAERHEADLFIDASGHHALLIEGALKTGYEQWSGLLPCDRMLVTESVSSADPKPMTLCRARTNGWEWHVPLQGRSHLGYVYCSEAMSEDQAISELGSTLDSVRSFRFVNGRRRQAWNRNCIALGSAAGFLEPLATTQLHLLQSGITKLAGLFPQRDHMKLESEEYSRLLAEEYDRARDLLVAHYHLAAIRTGAFWERFRDLALPPSLQHKLRVFKSRGRVVLYDGEVFDESTWATALLSQGLRPEHPDALARTLPAEQIRQQLDRMRSAIAQAAETMPSQAKLIQHHCAAKLGSAGAQA